MRVRLPRGCGTPRWWAVLQRWQAVERRRFRLKARLLKHTIATQVLREGTLENLGHLGDSPREKALQKLQSQIAWNVATTTFYKADGRPWKITGIRDGVCYIGLVFKKDDRGTSEKSAACGAQMFLDSGDGLVFKGTPGRWYDTKTKGFHLSREAARDLVGRAVAEYKRKREHQEPPTEVFIHGKVSFWREEWEGFRAAVAPGTKIVGVKIREAARDRAQPGRGRRALHRTHAGRTAGRDGPPARPRNCAVRGGVQQSDSGVGTISISGAVPEMGG